MKKKLLTLALLAMTAGATFVGCKEDHKSTRMVSGFFTVAGDVNSGYTFYQDYGGIVKPNMPELLSLIGKDGFVEDRIIGNFTFYDEDVKDVAGGKVIENAKFVSGEYMISWDAMAKGLADSKGVTLADSIFSVSRVTELWCYRGFLNVLSYAPVSVKDNKIITPTYSLVYDPTSIVPNRLELFLYYNRHSSMETNAGPIYDTYNSFSISELASLIPGNDSVEVTVRVKGAELKPFKVGRKDFRRGDYEPYK